MNRLSSPLSQQGRLCATLATALFLFTTLATAQPASALRVVAPHFAKEPVLVFNVTVDESVWRPCIAWGLTPSLPPNTTTQQNVIVQNCDSGRFVYTYDDNLNHPVLKPKFYSSVIVDASPPTCTIACKPVDNGPMPYRCSDCTVMDSREGFHLTTYKFNVVAWKWSA